MTRKRKYPDGRLGPDDEGELTSLVEVDRKHRRVTLHFGKNLSWVSMTVEQARRLSLVLRQSADDLEPPANLPLPAVNRVPQNLAGLAFLGVESLQVASYCEAADGQGQATEVHLLLESKSLPHPLLMRFHSPASLGQLIQALEFHRHEVWPGSR